MNKKKLWLIPAILIPLILIAILIVLVFFQLKTQDEAPYVELEIYDGPEYSELDDICYYRVEAIASGRPKPEIKFGEDGNVRLLGAERVEVGVEVDGSYTLVVTATNSLGTATASIILVGECRQELAEKEEEITEETEEEAILEETAPESEPELNSPPVISGLSFSEEALLIGKTYTVTVSASDPDGDQLSYIWNVSGGSVANATVNPIAWTTPSAAGNYQVTVRVSDGRSGEATAIREVAVLETPPVPEMPMPPHVVTVSLNPFLGGETGTITQDSTDIYLYGVFIGDSTTNRIVRGFISFDISGLAGKTLHSAELLLAAPEVQGNPSFLHGPITASYRGLQIRSTYWGARPLVPADYNLDSQIIASYIDYNITHTAVAGEPLVDYLQQRIDNGQPRFQVRLQFRRNTSNNNGFADLVKYQIPHNIILNVTYIEQ